MFFLARSNIFVPEIVYFQKYSYFCALFVILWFILKHHLINVNNYYQFNIQYFT